MKRKDKSKNKSRTGLAANIVSLIAVFLFMAAAALMQSGRLFGHTPGKTADNDTAATGAMAGDTVVINTSGLASDITGYSGPVPVEIKIFKGTVVSVTPLDNSETPGFFNRVIKSGITDKWNGLTVEKAAALHVDGVSGATFSSTALIKNVQTGLDSYLKEKGKGSASAQTAGNTDEKHSAAFFAALAVLIAAMSVPLFIKNPRYRIAQQILNTAVLGFWAGSFVDYTMMLGLVGGGVTSSTSAIAILMLISAFIYPLFGKHGYYCAWVCPLGSLQELASRCNPNHHITLSKRTVKILTSFRMILWAALMVCLWSGIWMSWIDYELFTAFLVGSASVGVVAAGAVIILLSIFIPRPYCRFVCPTGTLLRMSQDITAK